MRSAHFHGTADKDGSAVRSTHARLANALDSAFALLKAGRIPGKVDIDERAEALEVIRHDTAHVLAEAVQELFPGTQVTIGPNVEDGFFYDFAREEPFSLDDLAKIEARMRQIVDRDEKITREVWDRNEAIARMSRALKELKIEGIKTTAPLQSKIMENETFRTGDVFTNFLPKYIFGQE